MRAAGATQEQVARALDCSIETVRRTERWAEANGILEEAQHRFRKMLDKAAIVYDKRLADDANNPKLALDAARDIAFGTGALRKNHNDANSGIFEEESLTLILKRRREKLESYTPAPASGDPEERLPDITPEYSAEDASVSQPGAVSGVGRAESGGIDLARDARPTR